MTASKKTIWLFCFFVYIYFLSHKIKNIMSCIYINLPVKDLSKSTQFYKDLWFTQNMQFSDQNASGMEWTKNIRVMLLTHDFTKQFLPEDKEVADSHKTCEMLNALDFTSKEEVNLFAEKAIAAGAKETKNYDYGFMYGRDFEDLDWHIREAFFMDMSQMPQHTNS